jgi:hypothetical protein
MMRGLLQRRATCPACFKEYALGRRANLMVQHGYKKKGTWRIGACPGSWKADFGSTAGREVAAQTAREERAQAQRFYESAGRVERGEIPPARWNPKAQRTETIPEAEQVQRSLCVQQLREKAQWIDRIAAAIETRVETWKAKDPIVVEVKRRGRKRA